MRSPNPRSRVGCHRTYYEVLEHEQTRPHPMPSQITCSRSLASRTRLGMGTSTTWPLTSPSNSHDVSAKLSLQYLSFLEPWKATLRCSPARHPWAASLR